MTQAETIATVLAVGALALSGIEGILLSAHHRRAGRHVAARLIWPNLAAGACLLLALVAALTRFALPWSVAAAMSGALIAHVLDLRARQSAVTPGRANPRRGTGGDPP